MQCHPGGDCYWLGSRSKSVSMTWCCCQQLTWPYLLLATISNHHRVKFCGSLYDPDKSIKSLSSWLTLATTSAVRGRDGPRIQLALNSSLIYNVSTREIFKKNKHNPVDGWKQSCLQGFIHPRWCRISMDFLHEQSLYIADLINILILEFDSKIQMEHFFSAKETIGAAWSHFKEPQRGHVVMFFVALWPLRPTLRPTPNSWSCSMAHLFHHKVVHEFSHHLQATPTWRYCLRMVDGTDSSPLNEKWSSASQWWIKLDFDTRNILQIDLYNMEKSEHLGTSFAYFEGKIRWSLSKVKAWQHHQKRHWWGLTSIQLLHPFHSWHEPFQVGGYNPSFNHWSTWKSATNRGENKKYLKPPPRFCHLNFIPTCIHLFLYNPTEARNPTFWKLVTGWSAWGWKSGSWAFPKMKGCTDAYSQVDQVGVHWHDMLRLGRIKKTKWSFECIQDFGQTYYLIIHINLFIYQLVFNHIIFQQPGIRGKILCIPFWGEWKIHHLHVAKESSRPALESIEDPGSTATAPREIARSTNGAPSPAMQRYNGQPRGRFFQLRPPLAKKD